ISAASPEEWAFEIVQLELTAGMAGVPAEFSAVRLDAENAGKNLPGEIFRCPVGALALPVAAPDASVNFLPPSWRAEDRRRRRWAKMRRRLIAAAISYGLLLAAAAGYVVYLHQQQAALDRRLAEERPRLDQLQQQQARWQA